MSVLTETINNRRWELAALCLLLGLMEAVSKLPPDSVVGLLDVVDGGEDGQKKG